MKLCVDGAAAWAYTGGRPFDPALPVVVFVHGALNDHSVWTLPARWFAHHGHAVLAVDLPGHGRSAGPRVACVEAGADWALALLDAAGVAADRPVAWVGHSMGSLVALEAAVRAPARAGRLVMVGTTVPMPVNASMLALARERPLAAIDLVNQLSISGLASKPSHPGPGAWLHGGNRALMRRMLEQGGQDGGRNLFEHDFALCDGYAGGLDAAARVACPAHLLLGARDQMTPPRGTAALAAALRAQVTTLPCGHWLMGEDPDGVLAALRAAIVAG